MYEGQKLLAERSSLRQKSHSEVINGFIQEVLESQKLELQQIDYYAVGIGPGSFTGIRTALNIGKSFAYCFKKPIIGIDTLTNLASRATLQRKSQLQSSVQNEVRMEPAPKILALVNAFKNMVYYGLFEDLGSGNVNCLQGPGVMHVNELSTFLAEEKIQTVGDGFKVYEKYFSKDLLLKLEPIEGLDYPTATMLGWLAYSKIKNHQTKDWNFILPLYIRASEAEENKKGIVFIPLKEQ